MKKIKFPFEPYFQKGPQSIDPVVYFSILYHQYASDGRHPSCFNLPHSRGLTKEDLHPRDSASSCSQRCTAHNSPNTQAILLVRFSSYGRSATTKRPAMLPRAQEPHSIRLQGFRCMPICVMIQGER